MLTSVRPAQIEHQYETIGAGDQETKINLGSPQEFVRIKGISYHNTNHSSKLAYVGYTLGGKEVIFDTLELTSHPKYYFKQYDILLPQGANLIFKFTFVSNGDVYAFVIFAEIETYE